MIKKIFKPAIIHAHVASGAGVVAFFVKKLWGVPYVLTEHAPVELMSLSKRSVLKTNFILSESKANVAVSTDLKNKLNRVYPRAKFICIFNGVIDPYSRMGNKTIKYRRDDCVNAIIMCGLYSQTIKGLQYLLPALQMVNSKKKKIHLHVCGGGQFLEYFITMAETLGIENEVTFYGMCDKPLMYTILEQMDFAVSSSLYESAGVSVEEACMMGKPLVVTKSGGANSLIPDKFGIKVEAANVEALRDGLNTMRLSICKSSCCGTMR